MAVELCVKEIGNWMLRNKLKLNQDKTELLLTSSNYRVLDHPSTLYESAKK